jgi:ribose transport system permease protein
MTQHSQPEQKFNIRYLRGLHSAAALSRLPATVPQDLIELCRRSIFDLSLSVWVGWFLALAVWYVFECTPVGRYLLFIGSSISAAKLAGLRVNAYRQGVYIISGTIRAVAGILLAGTIGSVNPTACGSYLLPPITAAFLGASVIKLGRVNVAGTLVAICLLAVGVTGLQMLDFDSWISDVSNGAFLIFAVGLTLFLRKGSAE